jgi:hypothetical protein
MAHDRAGTGPWAWLKAVGTGEEPLDRDWRAVDKHLLPHCWFTKRPRSLRAGDVLVYYAPKWGRLPALMQLLSDDAEDVAEHPYGPQRWRWRMDVRPLVTLPLEVAPSLADVGVDSLRVRRQSHILLTTDEYTTARRLIVETASHEAQCVA